MNLLEIVGLVSLVGVFVALALFAWFVVVGIRDRRASERAKADWEKQRRDVIERLVVLRRLQREHREKEWCPNPEEETE